MRRWGQIAEYKTDEWYSEIAKDVYLPDIYLQAAQLLVNEGFVEKNDFPWDSDGFREPTNAFIDSIEFDGKKPNAYIDSLEIGLKADVRVSATQ